MSEIFDTDYIIVEDIEDMPWLAEEEMPWAINEGMQQAGEEGAPQIVDGHVVRVFENDPNIVIFEDFDLVGMFDQEHQEVVLIRDEEVVDVVPLANPRGGKSLVICVITGVVLSYNAITVVINYIFRFFYCIIFKIGVAFSYNAITIVTNYIFRLSYLYF